MNQYSIDNSLYSPYNAHLKDIYTGDERQMTWSDVPACPYPYQDGVAKIYDPFTGNVSNKNFWDLQ